MIALFRCFFPATC